MVDTFRTILTDADNTILDVLGETVVITGKGNLVGAFGDESGFELDVQGTRPVFEYQEADMVVVKGDILSYNGVVYTVRKSPESDGMGMGKLVLREN